MGKLEDRTFLFLVGAASVAFALIVWPFFGAILWGVTLSIVFVPLNDRLLRIWPRRRNLAALLTVATIMTLVILPTVLITSFLVEEASMLYARLRAGELDIGQTFAQFQAGLPDWANQFLKRLGLTDLNMVRAKLSEGFVNGIQGIAAQAFNISQHAFGFVVVVFIMLYLTFFLLRDGRQLSALISAALPLGAVQREALFDKFITVIRATIKGSLIVAILQGTLGGLVFWGIGIHAPLLWGVLMGFFSLLPAVGTGIIWVPVAIYLLATGSIGAAVVLIVCGVFVIGMVDNVLRPILVGKDARLPDYVVLVSTLGGIETMGFNGIIIGPVIAAMFLAVWEIFAASRRTT